LVAEPLVQRVLWGRAWVSILNGLRSPLKPLEARAWRRLNGSTIQLLNLSLVPRSVLRWLDFLSASGVVADLGRSDFGLLSGFGLRFSSPALTG
jgi:hypothetical protein